VLGLRRSVSLRRISKYFAGLLCASLITLAIPLFASSAGATVSSTQVINSGLQNPYQVAFNDGNMYIAGGVSWSLQEVTAAQLAGPAPYTPSTIVTVTPGLRITTVAFDSAGDLWFGEQEGGAVDEITAAQLAGPAPITPTQIFVSPSGSANSIAFDSAGNLFVADALSEIFEVTASQLHAVTPTITTVADFPGIIPVSLTFESGNLWVTNLEGGVDEILASQLGGAVITTASSIVSAADASLPWGLTFDSVGDLFIANQDPGEVYEVTATQLQSGSAPYATTLFATGFSNPIDLTFGPSGKLYLVDFGLSTVDELDYVEPTPSTPSLASISGLSVSESLGSISATWYPNANATSYTCTLMYGFNDPSTFSETTSATTCKYAVDSSTSWGIRVTANDSSGSSSGVTAFGSAVVAPPVKKVTKVTSIACTNGKHSRRFYGLHPTCPDGWRRK
jgi:hypothetical protein